MNLSDTLRSLSGVCFSIIRDSKLDPKVVSDNKQFWKTVKPLFRTKLTELLELLFLRVTSLYLTILKLSKSLKNILLIVLKD